MSLTTQRPASAPQPSAYDYPARTLGVRTAAPAASLLVAAIVGVVITAWVALRTATGQAYDETAMRVLDAGNSAINNRLITLLQQVSVGSAGLAAAIMIAVALVRRRFRVAVAAAVLVAGANLTTQLLKRQLLDRGQFGIGTIANTLPSGHTTVVFSLVLAAVLVSPRAVRWLVAFGGAAVGGLTGLATVIAGWHRPSDVVAGLLVTLAWAALVTFMAGGPRDGIVGRGAWLASLGGGALAAIGVIIYGFGWTAEPDASKVIPLTSAVIAGAAAVSVGAYAKLVARTSN